MGAYRILSLDGGGSWSLLQVMALQAIYGKGVRGHDVLKNFDFVAANSGGSIVMGGLLTNKPLGELKDFFLNQQARQSIFKSLPFELDEGPKPLKSLWNRAMRRFTSVGAKYQTGAKLQGLRSLLGPTGDKSLLELHRDFDMRHGKHLHFLVCGFDYDRKRAKFFRSNTASLSGSSQTPLPTFLPVNQKSEWRDATLAEAIHASSNAPVMYFVEPARIDYSVDGTKRDEERYWDGAIAGYNNPIIPAVVEALANRKYIKADNIQVLSIGTGTVLLPPKSLGPASDACLLQGDPKDLTLLGDLKELAGSILDDPPDSATYSAHVILGQALPDAKAVPPIRPPVSGTVIRMSPLIRPVRLYPGAKWLLPVGLRIDEFAQLTNLELDAVSQDEIGLLEKLGKLWLADAMSNQAIRENRNFEVQIGHHHFSEACRAWLALAAM